MELSPFCEELLLIFVHDSTGPGTRRALTSNRITRGVRRARGAGTGVVHLDHERR
jgi:hypothetical protein